MRYLDGTEGYFDMYGGLAGGGCTVWLVVSGGVCHSLAYILPGPVTLIQYCMYCTVQPPKESHHYPLHSPLR